MRRSGQIGFVVLGVTGAGVWGQCQDQWSEAFPPAVLSARGSARVVVYDDGSGARLIASALDRLGDEVGGLQVYDGQAWTTLALPVEVPGASAHLRAVNDANPPRLLADVETSLNRLVDFYVYEDGQWTATLFPDEFKDSHRVTCLEPGPDADLREIYAGGQFLRGANLYTLVYRWDGAVWTPLDETVGGAPVSDLAWFDDGSGWALYASVSQSINGIPVQGVARWDGVSWEEVGGGCQADGASLEVHDDGTGAALWALDNAGDVLAKWDGVSWTVHTLDPLARLSSAELTSVAVGGVRELMWTANEGFDSALWRWDGVDGARVSGTAGGKVFDLAADDSGEFGGLIAVGSFNNAGGVPAASVARWDGQAWHALGSEGVGNGAPRARVALALGDEAGAALGRRLYVASAQAGGLPTNGLGVWDGAAWEAIGPTGYWNPTVYELTFGDFGGGGRVFAAGEIRAARFGPRAVLQWDGESWAVLGEGPDSSMWAMEFGQLGAGGPTLFVGGSFKRVLGQTYNSVAALTPSGWAPLGDGIPSRNSFVNRVFTMRLHDDGTGVALYAGGEFWNGVPELGEGVVRWDGTAWAPVGGPLDEDLTTVRSLCSADLGNGPRLYAGGEFAGVGQALHNVAVWDGVAWSALGAGLPHPVHVLAEIDTPDGPRLAATVGPAQEALPTELLYLWNGVAWAPFGAIGDGWGNWIAQAPYEGDALYLTGTFRQIAGTPSEGIARFGCEPCRADFNGDGRVDTLDFLAFLGAWAAGDSSADFDGNGVLDTLDFLAYLNAWSVGC